MLVYIVGKEREETKEERRKEEREGKGRGKEGLQEYTSSLGRWQDG